ncbi:uncharacterized protein LOC127792416 [Diospyros lotus]|uniref:uncharacterized protein LOC127792416 n=1 Tax=Diospyros lotus TaxID=55363 RepID=UPI002257F16C|nr:uncharacterized protein LOC127792416 [Diospyros lotus]
MRCIHQCYSPFFPSLSRSKFRQQPNAARLLHPDTPLARRRTRRKPMAVSSTALVLAAAASPAKSGDISVLLQTSAVLLFAYGIANFVVPEIISRDLQFDQTSKDDDSPSENDRSKGSESESESDSDSDSK